MDASADKYESDDDQRQETLLAVSKSVRGMVRWLVGFFTVTEEDRSKAGIYIGSEEQDD